MIHVLSDDPDGVEQLDELRGQLGNPDLVALNTAVFDGQKLVFDDLVAACEAMPFLSERRLVIVRGMLCRFEQKASGQDGAEGDADEAKAPQAARQLRDYLPKLPESVELVFLESGPVTKRNPVYKALTTAGARLAQTAVLKGEALEAWIVRRVRRKGGRIARGVAALLSSYGAADLRTLDQELDKLVAYAGQGEIDRAAVQQLVEAAREVSVFKVGDAMAEGNIGAALGYLRQLVDEGESPQYLLSMIARHFRLLLQIKELREKGWGVEGIAGKLKVHPYPLERMIRQLRRYPKFQDLEKVHRRVLEIDAGAKMGKGDPVASLDLLIAELGRPVLK